MVSQRHTWCCYMKLRDGGWTRRTYVYDQPLQSRPGLYSALLWRCQRWIIHSVPSRCLWISGMQMHTEASLMWACLWWVSWFGSFSSTIKLQLLIQRTPGAWHMFLFSFCFKVNKLFLVPWLEIKPGFFLPLVEDLRCPKSTLSSSIGLLVSVAKSCLTLLQPHVL